MFLFSPKIWTQRQAGVPGAFSNAREGGGNDEFTKLLLHCEGADTSTTFTDSSASAHTQTAGGNAQVDTAQFKFGAASMLLDGTGDYVTSDGGADFAYGTGDFTIDFWARTNTAIAGNRVLFDHRPSGTEGLYPTIYHSATQLLYYTNSGNQITSGAALSTGAWYHIALARSGTSTKLFIDGTQVGSTYSDSNNYINGTSRPSIGIAGTDLSTAPWDGWFDEIRVSKGIARWTANFTPPTAAYF